MTQLVRYEAARTALAAAHSVDEVKDIRDKAEAMAAYARQAKDQELILWATEIKVRAERRAGEMIVTERAAGRMAAAGGDRRSENKIEQTSLKDYGISNDQGVRWTGLAAMPAEHFETAVATAKDTAGEVTTAFMLREANRLRSKSKISKANAARLEALEGSKPASVLVGHIRMVLMALRDKESLTEPERQALGQLRTEINKHLEFTQ